MKSAINTGVLPQGVQGVVPKSAIFGEVRPKIIFLLFQQLSITAYVNITRFYANFVRFIVK